VKAFIRNITFFVSFLLGSAGVVYARHPYSAYQQNSPIFLLIIIGLFVAICVISFFSDFLRQIVEAYLSDRNRYGNIDTPNIVIPNQRTAEAQEVYPVGQIRISFPDSPGNVDGANNNLIFTFSFRSINTIAHEVISEVKNKKLRGKL
jgi:hypothetical protein